MERSFWRLALVFSARVLCWPAVAAHAPAPMVLNALGDLGAAQVPSVAARVQNAAVADQSVGVPARIVVAQAQNVGEVDLIAVVDRDAVAVQNAAAFPPAALSGKGVAHSCALVDPDVERGSRFAQDVRVGPIARSDPFRPVVRSFPAVPAVHFVQADLFSQAAPDVPQGFRFPRLAVEWEQRAVVARAAPSRWCPEYRNLPVGPVADSFAPVALAGQTCCRLLCEHPLLDRGDPMERVPDELVSLLRLWAELRKQLEWRYPLKQLFSDRAH